MATVAFLGLGAMGTPMARRLLGAGHTLTVWNRSAARAAPLVADGARAARTPREAAEASEIVATMLADPEAIDAVAGGPDGLLAGLAPGTIWLDFSTVRPEDSIRYAALAREKGADFCDVPVAGSLVPARDGTLKVLAGGEAETLERARPVLDAVSKGVVHLGPVGAGSAMKLVNNLMFGVVLVGFGEALRLAERLGIGSERAIEWLIEGPAIAPYLRTKIDYLRAGGSPPYFPVRLIEKDLRLTVEAAGGDLAVSECVRETFARAMEAGLGDEDFSRVIEHLAGRRLAPRPE